MCQPTLKKFLAGAARAQHILVHSGVPSDKLHNIGDDLVEDPVLSCWHLCSLLAASCPYLALHWMVDCSTSSVWLTEQRQREWSRLLETPLLPSLFFGALG